jgi:hypothetical protein
VGKGTKRNLMVWLGTDPLPAIGDTMGGPQFHTSSAKGQWSRWPYLTFDCSVPEAEARAVWSLSVNGGALAMDYLARACDDGQP